MKYGYIRRLAALLAALMLLSAAALAEAVLPEGAAEAFDKEAAEEIIVSAPAEEAADEAGIIELGDDEPETLPDAEPGTDAAPEAGGIIELDALPLEAERNETAPAPEYPPVEHVIELTKNRSLTVNATDTVAVTAPGGEIVSARSSREKVARAPLDTLSGNQAQVETYRPGKAAITFTLKGGKKLKLTLNVKDPTTPTGLSLTQTAVTLRLGEDFNVRDCAVLAPDYAQGTLKYASSNKKIATVDSAGVVMARRAGSATVTVKCGKKLKAKLKVTVLPNRLDGLCPAPSADDIASLDNRWTLWPKSIEMPADGSIVCELYVLNGMDAKLAAVENLALSLSRVTGEGETVMAEQHFARIKVNGRKRSARTVRVTFPAKCVYWSGMDLSALSPADFAFHMHSMPYTITDRIAVRCTPTVIEYERDRDDDNPVTYRALLVSENDFYMSETPGNESAWEHIRRNRGDVGMMSAMLKNVRGAEGGGYAVKIRHNTTAAELKSLIASTFSGADDNDVSLFFIATHGISSSDAPDDYAGALAMASAGETYPEVLLISELRDCLLAVPGRVVVILQSCGSGAAIHANGGFDTKARAAARLDEQFVDAFRKADPGVVCDDEPLSNTGELRVMNKFYVLAASAIWEDSWGWEFPGEEYFDGYNHFTDWLVEGVGQSGSMPADKKYAGNRNGIVDLRELYRYIAAVGDHNAVNTDGHRYYQHVQVYPDNVRFGLFR